MSSDDVDVTVKTYPLDPNHRGIQLALLFGMGGGAILGFVLAVQLAAWFDVASSLRFWIGLIGALSSLILIGSQLERILRRRWSSGRRLVVSVDTIRLEEPQLEATSISLARPIANAQWYFVIPRGRGLVKAGWICASIALKQDDSQIIVYAFIDPESAERLDAWQSFERLYPRKSDPRDTAKSPPDTQSALREKEALRWSTGAEMISADFAEFLQIFNSAK